MSALEDAIEAAVEAALVRVLPAIVEAAVIRAIAELRTGDSGDDLLDTKETAKRLGMSAGAVRKATERGRFAIKPVRIGRQIRFRRADILALLTRPAPAGHQR